VTSYDKFMVRGDCNATLSAKDYQACTLESAAAVVWAMLVSGGSGTYASGSGTAFYPYLLPIPLVCPAPVPVR
jgi:hypothetical protein